jgi:hypothetical protein
VIAVSWCDLKLVAICEMSTRQYSTDVTLSKSEQSDQKRRSQPPQEPEVSNFGTLDPKGIPLEKTRPNDFNIDDDSTYLHINSLKGQRYTEAAVVGFVCA